MPSGVLGGSKAVLGLVIQNTAFYTVLETGENPLNSPNSLARAPRKVLTIFSIAVYIIAPKLALSILQKKLDAKQLGNILGISSPEVLTKENLLHHEAIYYRLGSQAQFNSNIFDDITLDTTAVLPGLFDREIVNSCTRVIRTLNIC